MRFREKVCVVTGSGQGIGRAAALRLAAEGGTIVVADWTLSSASETARLLEDHGAHAKVVTCNLTEYVDAERLMNEAVSTFGRVDVLVNVVGGTIWWQPFHKYEPDQIEREIERSLKTTLWCCRAALPHMIEQGGGAIVNLSSNVTQGGLYRAPYSASKGGVDALTRTLAIEYGRYLIRVNAVAPGSTKITTRSTSRLQLQPGVVAHAASGSEVFHKETRDRKSRAIDRDATPDEQASAIAFLASEDASYITGQILACDGGA